jgi:3-hydroxyacyl-[acyl-carrier-protein] dehydratase
MAQTAGALVVNHKGSQVEGSLVYFMTIDGARFRKPVVPGDTLHLAVRRTQQRSRVWRYEGKARVEGKLVAEAEISAMLIAS